MSLPEQPVVVVGMGELGALFAEGLLRTGRPVYPALRNTALSRMPEVVPDPSLVLITVGEHDLPGVLNELPHAWRGRVGLVQNELVPSVWLQHHVAAPTVAVVWFEKKGGGRPKVLLPTRLFGPAAALLGAALHRLGVLHDVLDDANALARELALKNLYILVTNIAGLRAQGTVAGLWENHRPLALSVASEVLTVQEALFGHALPRQELIEGLAAAFAADPEHRCLGRTAAERLQRLMKHAEHHRIAAPTLHSIWTDSRTAGRSS